ncbi:MULTISPECIES: DUF397 domain-containing protein [unclassified Kitasatospora]|uniref:DUF397 domain-containing protein n=1 Tax=unclassified Kitasatospora TaxID=2633591 RepID=UPI003415A5C7
MTDRVDLSGASWITSSYSNNGGNCVEVATDVPNLAPVRDSKDPEGPALVFPADTWSSFIATIRTGEFGEV